MGERDEKGYKSQLRCREDQMEWKKHALCHDRHQMVLVFRTGVCSVLSRESSPLQLCCTLA